MSQSFTLSNVEALGKEADPIPVTVLVPVRNEAGHLSRCLEALNQFDEVFVIDSQSTDATVEIASKHGARVAQFYYQGGWPKKRQWALDSLPIASPWVLLLDADEIVTPELANEIRCVIKADSHDGYWLRLNLTFLGGELRHGDASFWKLSLFRKGFGRFECRLRDQDDSMSDIEVHEHVVVHGRCGKLQSPLLHENVDSLSRYIRKHDQYSNWESRVLVGEEATGELTPTPFGNQAQQRRWLKLLLYRMPGSPLLLFFYRYFLRLGFLDGRPGFFYCAFQAIHLFQIKAKIYEQRRKAKFSRMGEDAFSGSPSSARDPEPQC